ncbi:hypothetical protein BGP_6372 [Beggiatoa sp. PS]|nr:hypothetical protein BGP_6372 [Beggiatoa sp. PS]
MKHQGKLLPDADILIVAIGFDLDLSFEFSY